MRYEQPTNDEHERLERRRDQYVHEQLTQAHNLDTTITDAAARIIAERLADDQGALSEFAQTGAIEPEAVKVELGVRLALDDSEESQRQVEALAEYVMAQPADGREALEDWELMTDLDTGEQYTLAAEYYGDIMTADEWRDRYLGTWQTSREYVEHLADELGYEMELRRALEGSSLPDDVAREVTFDYDAIWQTLYLSGEIAVIHMDDGRIVLLNNRA